MENLVVRTTDHLLSRFLERFPQKVPKDKRKTFMELLEKKKTGRLKALEWKVLCDLQLIVKAEILKAEETRRFINDTNFMTYLYDQYGYEARYNIRVIEDVVFVGLEQNGGIIFVTCYDNSRNHWFQHGTKFRKKATADEKE